MTSAVFSASAEETTKTLFTGSQSVGSWNSISISANDVKYFEEGATVTVEFSNDADDGAGTDIEYWQLCLKCDAEGWPALTDIEDVEGLTEFTFTLDAEDLELLSGASNFLISGYYNTVTSVTITGTENVPITGVWAKNGDGKWEITHDGTNMPDLVLNFSDYGIADPATIRSISVNWTITNSYGGGGLGASDINDDWVSANWANVEGQDTTTGTATVEFPDGCSGTTFQFQTWWAGAGAVVVLNEITITTESSPSAYVITVDPAITNGTVDTVFSEAEEGDTVTVIATPDDGYALDGITVTTVSGTAVTVADDGTFTMPAEAVIVSASFIANTYTVTIDNTADTNGTIALSGTKTAFAEGDTVTLTVTPKTGYELESITVDADGQEVDVDLDTLTFTMPAGDVTVSAAFKAIAVTGVTLNRATASVLVDGTVTLVATVSPKTALDTSVTWSSADTSIAKVDANGKVTGVSAGKTTITVKTTDGGYEASCTVTVTEEEIAVESITLDPTAVELEVGETTTITATVIPEDATYDSITWTSSNDAVATVENGEITAVAEGTATITAAIGDIEATCEVTVTAVAVESITLSEESVMLGIGETATLTATVSPANAAYDSITWTSSNDAIATVKDGVITAVTAGSVTITAAIGDITAECDVTVTETPESTGFDKVEADFDEDVIVAQTATVVDETTGEVTLSKRFVMMVSEADIENKSEVTFFLHFKNGEAAGTASLTTNNYYTSLVASGNKVDPADGCVFLSITIYNIPESAVLTCTDIKLS